MPAAMLCNRFARWGGLLQAGSYGRRAPTGGWLQEFFESVVHHAERVCSRVSCIGRLEI